MGKGGKHFRIVQAYRPCKSYGPLTAYSQQQKFFNTIAHTPAEKTYLSRHGELSKADLATEQLRPQSMSPIQRFLHDVCTDIAVWKLKGDQVVLMGDFNADVRTEPLKSMFTKLPMREIITTVNDPTKAPGTFNRYTDLAHGFGGDHRIGWADFTYENIFGHLLPAIERPIARRLRLGDPRVVAKFCDLREEHARRLQLATRTIKNEQQACYPPSEVINKATSVMN
eukprot:scaffold40262_cov58-Attheya_sp.AAC.1